MKEGVRSLEKASLRSCMHRITVYGLVLWLLFRSKSLRAFASRPSRTRFFPAVLRRAANTDSSRPCSSKAAVELSTSVSDPLSLHVGYWNTSCPCPQSVEAIAKMWLSSAVDISNKRVSPKRKSMLKKLRVPELTKAIASCVRSAINDEGNPRKDVDSRKRQRSTLCGLGIRRVLYP